MVYESFNFKDGSTASSVEELLSILENYSSHFDYHVTDFKNDFATWIQYSLLNPSLAVKLRGTNDYEETLGILEEDVQGTNSSAEEESQEETEEDDESSSVSEQWTKSDNVSPEAEKNEIEKEVNDLMNETKKVSEQFENSHVNQVEDKKLPKINVKNHRIHELRAMLLGAVFGVLVGMIVMYVLIMNGVF